MVDAVLGSGDGRSRENAELSSATLNLFDVPI